MNTHLQAIVLAIWSILAPGGEGHRVEVVDGIVWAVEHDARRGDTPQDVEAAVLAYYAWHESRLERAPYPRSWDASAGVSCDVWQMPCAIVRGWSLREQAATWLRWVHEVGIGSVDSSPSRATRRVARAMVLLGLARERVDLVPR
jgi:hypothetical protein